MTTEAIELADMIDRSEDATGFERRMASVMRSQAAEIERLTAENEANMQTCKGIIKGLTADRKRKDALLRECLTALEYHTDHTLDTMDKVKTELGEQT